MWKLIAVLLVGLGIGWGLSVLQTYRAASMDTREERHARQVVNDLVDQPSPPTTRQVEEAHEAINAAWRSLGRTPPAR